MNNLLTLDLEFLHKVLQKAANKHGFKIGLFGSCARRQNRPSSDVDLLLFEDGKILSNNNSKDKYDFRKHLEDIIGKEVSIYYYDDLKDCVKGSLQKDLIVFNPEQNKLI